MSKEFWIGLGLLLFPLFNSGATARAESVNSALPVEATPIEKSSLAVQGDFRFRQEYYGHTDFMSERADSLLRVRPALTWTASPELTILLQPQAAKAFGEVDFVPNSTTTNAETPSSGKTNSDTAPLSFHQAYADYHPFESLNLRLGRQVIVYGDELVVGAAEWVNVARNFDAVKLSYRHRFGQSDLFTAKLTDTNVTTGGPGDRDFHGIYNALSLGPYVGQFDVYVFDLHDASKSIMPPSTLLAFGARAKSVLGPVDYRVEYTRERGFAAADGAQLNPEVGFTFRNLTWRPRVSAEYFMATADYNQLFPSPHPWLGYADVLGRRNVDGFALHASAPVNDKLEAKLEYYYFRRHQTSQAVFATDGVTPIGSADASGSAALGSEVDLTLRYRTSPRLLWALGYSQFFSGAYFGDQFHKKNPSYAYVQLEATY